MKIKKVFRSRMSVLLIGFVLAINIPVFIRMFQDKRYQDLIPIVGVWLFIFFVFAGIRYVISDEKLFLRFWFIPCGSTDIIKIIKIERSYNLLSSPACSLKRLKITFAKGQSWLVSPVREQEFIEMLKAVNTNINLNVTNKEGKWRIQDWDI